MRFRLLLLAVLASALSSPALAQDKAKAEKKPAPDAALVTLGGLSAGYMFESHQKIGHVVDAYAAKTLDLNAAAKDLGATQALLQLIDKQLLDVINTVKLSDADSQSFEDIRKVLATEVKSIKSILSYWKDKNEGDLKAYTSHRSDAWKNISSQLNLGRAEVKAMQGSWSATKAGNNGEDAPADDLKAIKFVIKDDVITFTMGKDSNAAKMTLNLITSPNQLDAEVLDGPSKGKTRLGIYEIKGDVMKLCWSRGDKRPTKFNGDQGADVIYFELKRDKE